MTSSVDLFPVFETSPEIIRFSKHTAIFFYNDIDGICDGGKGLVQRDDNHKKVIIMPQNGGKIKLTWSLPYILKENFVLIVAEGSMQYCLIFDDPNDAKQLVDVIMDFQDEQDSSIGNNYEELTRNFVGLMVKLFRHFGNIRLFEKTVCAKLLIENFRDDDIWVKTLKDEGCWSEVERVAPESLIRKEEKKAARAAFEAEKEVNRKELMERKKVSKGDKCAETDEPPIKREKISDFEIILNDDIEPDAPMIKGEIPGPVINLEYPERTYDPVELSDPIPKENFDLIWRNLKQRPIQSYVVYHPKDRSKVVEFVYQKSTKKYFCFQCKQHKNEATVEKIGETLIPGGKPHVCTYVEYYPPRSLQLLPPQFRVRGIEYDSGVRRQKVEADINGIIYTYVTRLDFFICSGCLKKGEYSLALLMDNEKSFLVIDLDHCCNE